jgi:membrane protein YqaA with SNARE-associated domain
MPPALLSPPGIYLATFLFSLLGGIVPFLNVEAYLLSLSALSPQTATVPAVLAASLGQMAAKVLLYLAGRGLLKFPLRSGGRLQEAAARFASSKGHADALVLASAVTGIPPFYGVSVAAGLLRFPLARFVVLGTLGRLLRFAGVFLLPRIL